MLGRLITRTHQRGRHAGVLAACAAAVLLGAGSARGQEMCFSCHAAPGLAERLKSPQGTTPQHEEMIFKGKAHVGLKCVECHPGAERVPHHTPLEPRPCQACHTTIPQHVVGPGPANPPPNAGPPPTCITCHGYHGIPPPSDPDSRVARARVPALCATCHARWPGARTSVRAYMQSVHGLAHQRNPSGPAAVCVDCHGAHGMRAGSDPESPVSRARVATTCAKCHAGIYAKYEESIHGRAMRDGVTEAPTCTDCHREHNIQAPTQPTSSVYPSNVGRTCTRCHDDREVQRKFGLPPDRMATFVGSYHGVASIYGDTRVANCASCHGIHDILPSSDPRSRVNKANLPKTCGKCHAGATRRFAEGSVHVLPSPHRDRLIYYVRLAYQILIGLIISSFVVYILLDVASHVYRRIRGEGERIPWRWSRRHERGRFTLNEIVQHWVLLVSFFVLVITGMALLFPETPMAALVMTLSGGPQGRAIVHRVAGALLIGGFLYHVAWLLGTAGGRQELKAFLPRWRDVTDILGVLAYMAGRRREPPTFSRYNFVEKGEYYAVIWGTVVMGATGIIMAFVNQSLRVLSLRLWDVAKVIHGWEAVLAALAIVIWHFYHVFAAEPPHREEETPEPPGEGRGNS